jgi:hypothetical protein
LESIPAIKEINSQLTRSASEISLETLASDDVFDRSDCPSPAETCVALEDSIGDHPWRVSAGARQYEIYLLEPSCFSLTIGMPLYSEIKLAVDLWRVPLLIEEVEPHAIHIFTEGPIGRGFMSF